MTVLEVSNYVDAVRALDNAMFPEANYSPYINLSGVLMTMINLGKTVEEVQEYLDKKTEDFKQELLELTLAS